MARIIDTSTSSPDDFRSPRRKTHMNKFPLTDFELGWLCGLLEGEGYFSFDKKTQRVSVEMTDEDVVIRVAILFQKLTGVMPNIIERPPHSKASRNTFMLYSGGANARLIMRAVVRYMSIRRRARIWQSLNKFRPKTGTIDLKSLELLK